MENDKKKTKVSEETKSTFVHETNTVEMIALERTPAERFSLHHEGNKEMIGARHISSTYSDPSSMKKNLCVCCGCKVCTCALKPYPPSSSRKSGATPNKPLQVSIEPSIVSAEPPTGGTRFPASWGKGDRIGTTPSSEMIPVSKRYAPLGQAPGAPSSVKSAPPARASDPSAKPTQAFRPSGQNELSEEFIAPPQVASRLESMKPDWLSKKPLPPPVPAKPTQTPQYGQPSSPATEKTLELVLPSTLPVDWGRTEIEEIMAPPSSRKNLEAGRPAKSYDSDSIEEEVDTLPACSCLPGLCKCPGGHYVFSKKWQQHLIKKYGPSAVNESPVELADPAVYEKFLTPRSSECVCYHSGDDVEPHFQTPASGSWTDDVSESTETRLRRQLQRSGRGGPRFLEGANNERTLAVIKPQALQFKDVVLRAINRAGLDIINARTLKLTAEQVSEIYKQHYESEKFPVLVMSLQGAPILVLALAGLDAVNRWNKLVGPTKVLPSEWFFPNSVVKRFGLHQDKSYSFHASEDIVSAEVENRYFFPNSIIEPIKHTKSKVTDYCGKYVNPTLMKGLAAVIRAKPSDPVVFLAEWLLLNNPFQPAFPRNVSFART